jgi:hypothetical protein
MPVADHAGSTIVSGRGAVPWGPGIYVVHLKDNTFYIGKSIFSMRYRAYKATNSSRHTVHKLGYTDADVLGYEYISNSNLGKLSAWENGLIASQGGPKAPYVHNQKWGVKDGGPPPGFTLP